LTDFEQIPREFESIYLEIEKEKKELGLSCSFSLHDGLGGIPATASRGGIEIPAKEEERKWKRFGKYLRRM